MIIPFLGGTLHAILLQADWYMVLTAIIGIYVWFDCVFLMPRRGTRARVTSARTLGRIRELVLTPEGPFPTAPGSFVLLGHEGRGHPFSISDIDAAGRVRLSVNMSGPFTRSLAHVAAGDTVALRGPYGHFGSDVLGSNVPQLWIAGGIGITPFLSLASALARTRPEQQLHVLWSVRGLEQAVYRAEIEAWLATMPNAHLIVHDSHVSRRLTVATSPANASHCATFAIQGAAVCRE